MKNFISYYYNLLVSEIRKIDDYYVFNISGKEYEFLPYYGNVDTLYKNYLTVINSGRYVHEIVLNNSRSIVTLYENNPYILLKKNINSDNKINLNYILNYDVAIYKKIDFDWKNLWKEKIDYYEYQVREIGFKYILIKESFNYYAGLSELAISLLNYVEIKEVNSYISHKRIKLKETESSFCNPLNIVIENKARDIGEYLKINYIHENIKLDDTINSLDKISLNRSEAILLLARLIYPSYYFDTYDKIIQQKIDQNKINFYIEKNVYYETFLKQIYKFLKYKYNIPEIEWLEN